MAEIDYAEGLDDPIQQRFKYGRPEDIQSIRREDRGLMSRLASKVQEAGESAGLSREASRKLGSAAEVVGASTPVVGDVSDAYDLRKAAEKGDIEGAVASGLGFVPFIGGALRKGAEMTFELFKGADKLVQDEAIRLTAQDLGRVPNPDSPKDVKALVLNARDVERKLIMEDAVRKDAPRAEDRADWLFRDREDPVMYHGTKKGSADSIDYEGMVPSMHSELGDEGTSFSSDPIYASRHFGESDTSQLFEGRLNDPEMAKDVRNLTPEEYDLSHEMRSILNREDEEIGVKIPKTTSFSSEAETVIFDPQADMTIERLRDSNPEKAAWLQEGVDKANVVIDTQESIVNTLLELGSDGGNLTPAQAREIYTGLRDNLREALSLAKYTEDNSARGTFDWYISNFMRTTDDEVDVQTGLETLQSALVGEQNKEELGKLIEAIDMYKLDADAGVHSASDMATGTARQAKEQIIDSAKTMAVGGLVTNDRTKEVQHLNALYKEGGIDGSTYSKALRQLTEKYKPTMR